MTAPNPAPGADARARVSFRVAAIAVLLATVSACFMVNYDNFLAVEDGGLDAGGRDAEPPGSTGDSEASTGQPDADVQNSDGAMPPDAAGTDDDASMNAPDADPAKPDAGARDAGSDASSDAGRDSGTDAGDAGRDADANSDGATDGGEMDAQETSVPSDGATDAMPCPEAGCTQTCGPGPTCPYTCLTGMSCTFDCRTATPCNVVCQPGSQCEVISDLGSQDSVSCLANASCGRVCNDKLNCNFAPCEGGVIGSFFTCTASVNRCNWTCPP